MRERRWHFGFFGLLTVLAISSARAAAPLPLPPGPPSPRGMCEPACDYASGAGCPEVSVESLTVYPYDGESLTNLEAYAVACPSEWEGPGGCYEARIRKAVDELLDASKAISDTALRASLLPDAARHECERFEPLNAQRAVDEAPAWCVTGREECIEALRDAHRVLMVMPTWATCVQRMEAYADENARRETRNDCEPAPLEPAPAPRLSARSPTPARTPTPALAPPPQSRGILDPPVLEVVHARPVPPRRRAPAPDPSPPANDPLLADQIAARAPAPDTATVSSLQTQPKGIDDGRRGGQFELLFAPFSGVLTIRDPATKAEHRPLMASIGMGLDVVLELSPAFGLEFGLAGRGSFASTALQQAVSLGLAELDIATGTAFVFEIEPSVTLLSEYLGIGMVADYRWDTIGITSATAGLVSTKSSGGAGGLRLLAGLGVLERDMRLLFTLDWMFVATESTVIRASLQGEIGPFVLVGSYREHYRLGTTTEAYVADDLQLTLGYRMMF